MTTVEVSERNWKRLTKLKEPGDTYDDIVDELLDHYGVYLDPAEINTTNGRDGHDRG